MLTYLGVLYIKSHKKDLKKRSFSQIEISKTLQPQQIMFLNLKLHIVVFRLRKNIAFDK